MNLFGISSIILSLSGIIFSFIIFRSDKTKKVNRYWFVSCISFSLWSLALYGVTSSNSTAAAFSWQFLLDIGAIFLPATYFLFISEFLEYKNHNYRVGSITLAILFSCFSFTPFFKIGVQRLDDLYWINPGPLYFLFPLYFVTYAVICITLLIRSYLKAPKKSPLKGQIRNMLLGGLMGYAGGVTDFFPQVFNVYPFGNYLVILYIVFMVYGVLRYKLLSTKVVSAQLFSTALILGFLFILLRSSTLTDWVVNFIMFGLVVFFSLLLVNSVNSEVKAREKIEALAKDLEKANERLQELDQQKSEFVSLASHQLRGPLTAIKGYASLILEGDFGEPPQTIKEAVEKIFKSTQALVILVGDYLDVSRIEQGRMKYDFSTFNLKELVASIIEELKPTITAAKLDITFDFNVNDTYNVNADQGKIKQVISNLIDNATKYTPKGWIKVAIMKRLDRTIITISDTGVGIRPDVLPRLFEKFTRAPDASKTNIMGTGLGLYVAKKIIEAHEGKIWAESEGLNKGSTFHIELKSA